MASAPEVSLSMLRGRKSGGSYDKRLLDAADRLFSEFEALPVRWVFDAIQQARQSLRDAGMLVPAPEVVEARAHETLERRLRAELAA